MNFFHWYDCSFKVGHILSAVPNWLFAVEVPITAVLMGLFILKSENAILEIVVSLRPIFL